MPASTLEKAYVGRFLRPLPSATRCVPEPVREQARALLREEGRYAQAIALLEAQPALPQDPLALKLCGVARLALHDTAGADRDFAAAARLLARELSAVYCNQAASAIEQDRPETALTAAQAAYAADPHWVLPIVNQLSALALQGMVDAAWQVLTQALSQWPEGRQDPELHRYLAEDGLLSVLRTDPRFQQWLASTNPSIGDHYHA